MSTAFAYRSKDSCFSDSDSDDSDKECLNWKRVTRNVEDPLEKIPLIPPPAEPSPVSIENPQSLKRKRNTIWSEVLEDQIMSETLNYCGLKNKPKDYGERGAESYDYRLKKNYYKNNESDDEMSDSSRSKSPRPYKKFRNDRFVKLDPEELQVARQIVRKLSEPKTHLIYRIVKFLGMEKSLQLMKMTEEIEDNGGMMIKNQQRRRTPGGVYLHLLRSDTSIEKATVDKVFEGELNSYERKKKFDEIKKLKKKRKNRKKNKKGKKDSMDCQSLAPKNTDEVKESVPEFKKESEPEEMEDDMDNGSSGCSNDKEATSELEEGEID